MASIQQRADDVRAELGLRYVPAQYRYVEFVVDHLTDLSRSFGGDLQQPFMLAIIGQVYLHALHRSGLDPATFLHGLESAAGENAASITASRMADVTGMPRETVRRKLHAMERKGWVEHLPNGAWRLNGRRIRESFSELDARGMTRLSRLFADIESLLSESVDAK